MKKTEKKCCDTHQHPDHKKEISKLNRVSGQIDGVKKMIDEKRYCPDILIQLKAIKSAINSIETDMLEAHLRACVVDAFNSADKKEIDSKINELKDLFKRY